MDFEKKHQEDLQRLRGFRLLDDDFMTKVFEDISCAELLLRIILNDEGIRVLEATTHIHTYSRLIQGAE